MRSIKQVSNKMKRAPFLLQVKEKVREDLGSMNIDTPFMGLTDPRAALNTEGLDDDISSVENSEGEYIETEDFSLPSDAAKLQ